VPSWYSGAACLAARHTGLTPRWEVANGREVTNFIARSAVARGNARRDPTWHTCARSSLPALGSQATIPTRHRCAAIFTANPTPNTTPGPAMIGNSSCQPIQLHGIRSTNRIAIAKNANEMLNSQSALFMWGARTDEHHGCRFGSVAKKFNTTMPVRRARGNP
jgi:hypothetical protein